MANIFISYNREDKEKTKALVDDMEKLGHDVWFDQELSGGQKWWTQILNSIRSCDLFVFVLSVDGLDSAACSLEYEYADALGKTILPVLVGEGVSPNLLPPILSQIQFVDYQKPDRNAILNLAKAFTALPASKPLPDPLPTPPEVPISYLGSLGKQIESTSKLSYEEQSALLVDLKRGLHDSETKIDSRTLLKKLRKRQYLFENIANEIDELLDASVKDIKMATQDSKTKYTMPKQPLNQKMKNSEGDKTSFWISLWGTITGLVIAVGLYFIYTYFIVPSQYSYVCYDKKIEGTQGELFYKGCEIYSIDCISSKKEHFGRYLNKADAKVAYERCIKGKPLIVPSSEAQQPEENVSVPMLGLMSSLSIVPHPTEIRQTMHLDEYGIEVSIIYPRYVEAGKSFTIKATMLNKHVGARMGGLTLSFPDMILIGGESIENSFDTLNNYIPPTKLYSSITKSNIVSKYVVIEGWQNGWAVNKSKSFSIRFIAPPHIRNLRVNVRAVLVVGTTNNKREVAIPVYSNITDQQGYYAKQFSITIKE